MDVTRAITPVALTEADLSIVVPTHNTRDLTAACLERIAPLLDRGTQIVLVDDGGCDGTAEMTAVRFPGVHVHRRLAADGFTLAANEGMALARGALTLLLNSDTELDVSTLPNLFAAFDGDAQLGAAGASLVYPDGTPQWSGGAYPTLTWLFGLASGLPRLLRRLSLYRSLRPVSGTAHPEVEWVTAAAVAVRREAWEQVGPLDERYIVYCQDLDFCSALGDAGWGVQVVPGFRVMHHHGATLSRAARAWVGHERADVLWPDLLRWGAKYRGPAWARCAATALALGGALGLLLTRDAEQRRAISTARAAVRAWRRQPS